MEVELHAATATATVTFEKEKREIAEHQKEEERWLNHYSSLHQILVVGDGDFSFSLCLANSFGSGSNLVASSLDSFDEVTRKYKNAKSNLEKLEHLGATILHRVDAVKMKLHTDLRMRKFDRIIFNFPHAGFHGKEDASHLIRMHRNLVSGFFRSASGMLRADGEIHVNHKTTAPFCHWDLTGLASNSSLILFECVDFRITDYPGYNNKRGDGPRCDKPFPLGKCSTFKYTLSPYGKKTPKSSNHYGFAQQRPPSIQLSTLNSSHSGALFEPSENECFRVFGGYFNHAMATFGRVDHNIWLSVRQGLERAYVKYTVEKGGSLSGYINLLEQLHHLSKLRSEWLRQNLFYLDQQPIL